MRPVYSYVALATSVPVGVFNQDIFHRITPHSDLSYLRRLDGNLIRMQCYRYYLTDESQILPRGIIARLYPWRSFHSITQLKSIKEGRA